MRNLIIALVLLFAGLNEVQSQTRAGVKVRPLTNGTETVYHIFSDDQSVFLYTGAFQPVPGAEFQYAIQQNPAATDGPLFYNNNTYQISGDYARNAGSIVVNYGAGAGGIMNADGSRKSSNDANMIRLNFPEWYVQLAIDRWTYREGGGGTMLSPNRLYEIASNGPGDYRVVRTSSPGASFRAFNGTTNPGLNEYQLQLEIIRWYDCVVAGSDDAGPVCNQ